MFVVSIFLCVFCGDTLTSNNQSATLATSPMPAASKITRGLVKAL